MIKNDGRKTTIKGNFGQVLNEYVNITHSLSAWLKKRYKQDEYVSAKTVALCVKVAYADSEDEVSRLAEEIQELADGGA